MKRTRGMLRFASIGLLTMTPGMAHAETYQEHYMRLSKASKAIAPFADAWRTCVIRKAMEFALQPEPAETIITAAFAACDNQETSWRVAIIKNGLDNDGTEALVRAKEDARGRLTLQILEMRAKGRPTP